MKSGNVSGWFARLDRICPNREEQIDVWLTSWELSLKKQKPIAAVLPHEWPTLPASLLSDAGNVLDQLICRFDAEKDGRSPRGANPTPVALVDAIIADELVNDIEPTTTNKQQPKINLAALPPGFHIHLDEMNFDEDEINCLDDEIDEETLLEIKEKARTRSGIPLPFADPSLAGGLFPARLIRWHSTAITKFSNEEKLEDTRTLLSKLQLVDICDTAKVASLRRLYLELVRYELASIDDENIDGMLTKTESMKLLDSAIVIEDTLQGDWPWNEPPRLLLTNPPWLRIKDKFRGHENGSSLRKNLGNELRNLKDKNGELRYSALRGNVNLYRLFIERSLQIVKPGGRIRLIVPDSLLREQSSSPLRSLLVNKHEWTSIWTFPESARLFAGATQGVLVLGLTVGGETDGLLSFGPVEKSDLCSRNGLVANVPCITLDKERWRRWTQGDWSVPRLPRERHLRDELLSIIDELADSTRLSDSNHWLSGKDECVRVRVGEVDQTSWSEDIYPWKKGSRGIPFVRGIHFRSNHNDVWLHHPAFNPQISKSAPERKQALWRGSIGAAKLPRLACQAIVNAQQTRRLRWVVLPAGSVIGNSVNHLQLPEDVMKMLSQIHNNYEDALEWLCELLNSEKLDAWACAWAANNNVNNYELELLPLPPGNYEIGSRLV